MIVLLLLILLMVGMVTMVVMITVRRAEKASKQASNPPTHPPTKCLPPSLIHTITPSLLPGAEFSQCSLKEMMNCMAVKINTVMETALEKGDLLGCPRPCHALRYLPIISSAFFPAPAFFSVLQNSTLNVTSLSEFR